MQQHHNLGLNTWAVVLQLDKVLDLVPTMLQLQIQAATFQTSLYQPDRITDQVGQSPNLLTNSISNQSGRPNQE